MKLFRNTLFAAVIMSGLMSSSSLHAATTGAADAGADKSTCTGRTPNMITDVCWKCIFPIRVASVPVASFGQEDSSEDSAKTPICTCPAPPPLFVRVGVVISFWEPIRIIEVVRKPYCFPLLGGVQMSEGTRAPEGAKSHNYDVGKARVTTKAFYQAHYYISPLASILQMITSWGGCADNSEFDLAYMTELDPLWADDEASFILNPEAVIFANPVAQLACAADCVAASAGFPISALLWCAGCQGSVYPLTGHIGGNTVTAGGVESSVLIAQRMLYKLHRQGLLQSTTGYGSLCKKQTVYNLKKGQYKTQLIYPIPETVGTGAAHPFCCQPLGRTTMLWGLGKQFPVKGEDFSYLIWRKRECCASY